MDQATIDTLRHKPVAAQRLFIGGDFADSRDGATLPVISPSDGTVLTSIADAGAHDVDRAVAAARAAGMLIIWFQNGWDDQYVEAGGPGEVDIVDNRSGGGNVKSGEVEIPALAGVGVLHIDDDQRALLRREGQGFRASG